MRLFIAITIPELVKEEIARLQAGLPNELSKTKNTHLTLKFLGEVNNNKPIISALEKVTSSKINASLSTIGVFPSEKKIRVIWVGVHPENEINELHDKIDDVLAKRFDRDNRFKSHITLARAKNTNSELYNKIKSLDVNNQDFNINSFILYKSILGKEVVHEPLKKFNLE